MADRRPEQPAANGDQPSASPPSWIGEIGKVLAGAIKEPVLATIVLIVLIVAAAMVTMFGLNPREMSGAIRVVALFVGLAVFALILVFAYFILGRRAQQRDIRQLSTQELDVGTDTFALAAQLSDAKRADIRALLRAAAEDVAGALDTPSELVRANLFGLDADRLRIIPELTYNMDNPEELTVSVPVGYGSTGRAFQSGRPNVALFRTDWGPDTLENDEQRKLHRDLQWIISIPVKPSRPDAKPVWILNIDGLQRKPDQRELETALQGLVHYSQMIYIILTGGLGGDKR